MQLYDFHVVFPPIFSTGQDNKTTSFNRGSNLSCTGGCRADHVQLKMNRRKRETATWNITVIYRTYRSRNYKHLPLNSSSDKEECVELERQRTFLSRNFINPLSYQSGKRNGR